MFLSPELKPNKEPLMIAATSSHTCTKPNVQATPAVGLPHFANLIVIKSAFLLFIKYKQKCKQMKFQPKH